MHHDGLTWLNLQKLAELRPITKNQRCQFVQQSFQKKTPYLICENKLFSFSKHVDQVSPSWCTAMSVRDFFPKIWYGNAKKLIFATQSPTLNDTHLSGNLLWFHQYLQKIDNECAMEGFLQCLYFPLRQMGVGWVVYECFCINLCKASDRNH